MTSSKRNYFANFQAKTAKDSPGLPENLTVRPARSEDVLGLAMLLQEREGGSLEEYQRHFEREVSEQENGGRRLLLIAQKDYVLTGYGRVLFFEPSLNAPAHTAPAGWYLAGLVVAKAYRRCGIGAELTRQRLNWIRERAAEAFYFVNAQNQASIALHKGFQFEEVTRDFVYPDVTFIGGVGVLYRTILC